MPDKAVPPPAAELPDDATMAYVPITDRMDQALTPDEAKGVTGFAGYALVVSKGPRAGMTFVLVKPNTQVGRHPDSDIFLDDVTVSRHHCRLSWGKEQLVIEDSGSTNGTYVNSVRIDRAALQPGDEVLIGRFHLIVAQGDA